jgi:hypothetical protein
MSNNAIFDEPQAKETKGKKPNVEVMLEVSNEFRARQYAKAKTDPATASKLDYLQVCKLFSLKPRAYQLFEAEDLIELQSVQSDFLEYLKKKNYKFNPFEDGSTLFWKGFSFAGINTKTMVCNYSDTDLTFNGVHLGDTPKGEKLHPVFYNDDRVLYVLGDENIMRQSGRSDFTQIHLLSLTPSPILYKFLTKG